MQTFHIATFGCKVNQYDSEVLREALIVAGCRECSFKARPDYVIVNTCTVTGAADAKERRFIARARRECPDARIIVTGCLAERNPGWLAQAVWKAVPNDEKQDIPRMIAPDAPMLDAVRGFAGHTRAFIKVQDGCDAGCSYCIVPSVRGKPQSRPLAEVLDETRTLTCRFKEIVLAGIHLGIYRGTDGEGLATLVRAILDSTPVERLRLSSIELNEVTPELLDIAVREPRFCPHFHVPLQSGSNAVLQRMNRCYTAEKFLARLGEIRNVLGRPSFSTDVMVGFPGESDADFDATIAVCRAAGFSRMHIFPFSARPGTAAAEMGDKCAAAIISQRESALLSLADKLALEYKQQFIGETVHVLVEAKRDRTGNLCGYTERYLRVLFDGPDELRGNIVPVPIVRANSDAMFGKL